MTSKAKDHFQFHTQSRSYSIDSDCHPSCDSSSSCLASNFDSTSNSSLFESNSINALSDSHSNQATSMNHHSTDRDPKANTRPGGSESSHKRMASSSQDHYSSGKHSFSRELGFEEWRTDSNDSNYASKLKSSHKREESHSIYPVDSSILPSPLVQSDVQSLQYSSRNYQSSNHILNGNQKTMETKECNVVADDDRQRPKLKHKRALRSINSSQGTNGKLTEDRKDRFSELGEKAEEIDKVHQVLPALNTQIQQSGALQSCSIEDHRQTQLEVKKMRSFPARLPSSHSGRHFTQLQPSKTSLGKEDKENTPSSSTFASTSQVKINPRSNYLLPPLPPTSSTPPPSRQQRKSHLRDSDSFLDTSFLSSTLSSPNESIQPKQHRLNFENPNRPKSKVPLDDPTTSSPSAPKPEIPFTFPSRAETPEPVNHSQLTHGRAEGGDTYSSSKCEMELSSRRVGLLNELGLENGGKGKENMVKDEQKEKSAFTVAPQVEPNSGGAWYGKKLRSKSKAKEKEVMESQSRFLPFPRDENRSSTPVAAPSRERKQSKGSGTRQRLLSLFRGQKLFANKTKPQSPAKMNPILTPPRSKSCHPVPVNSPPRSSNARRRFVDRKFKVTSPGRTPPRTFTPRRVVSPNRPQNQAFSPSVSQSRSRTLAQLHRKQASSHHLSPRPPTPRSQTYAIIRKEQVRRARNEERLKALAYLNGDLDARIQNRRRGEIWKEVGGKVNLTKNFEKERLEVEAELQRREIPKWKSGIFKDQDNSWFNDGTPRENVHLSRPDQIEDGNLSASFLEPPSTPNSHRNSSTPSSIGRPPVPIDVSCGINNLLRSHERARELARREFVDLNTPER